jgi:tRNA modification GTPase
VVRVSGPRAVAIADAVFRGASRLECAAGNTLHHGWAVEVGPARESDTTHEQGAARDHGAAHDGGAAREHASAREAGRRVDEVVVALFRSPHSYTREDVVEISCHGGTMPARRVLDALLAAGARLATPGEFTLRAFLNGRIDLAQAEAVADLIHAETQAAHELALSQLAGGLSRRLDAVSERVTDALAEVEARVDFAEDVGGVEVPAHVSAAITECERALAALLQGAEWARAVREGLRVPIVGRPNVGKSSLFNALLGEERAIVTAVPGTTRDRVSEAIEIAGVRVTLSDTAGLRESAEPVEAIGIGLARAALEEAPVALWVVDAAESLAPEDRWIAEKLRAKRVLVALNKSDRPGVTRGDDVTPCSTASRGAWSRSRRRAARDSRSCARRWPRCWARMRRVARALRGGVGGAHGADGAGALRGPGDAGGIAAAVSNARHADALERARAALARAGALAARGEPGELVALELRESLGTIGEVTGRSVGEDLLDRIFSRFCIGK